jgi:hypothetical protein
MTTVNQTYAEVLLSDIRRDYPNGYAHIWENQRWVNIMSNYCHEDKALYGEMEHAGFAQAARVCAQNEYALKKPFEVGMQVMHMLTAKPIGFKCRSIHDTRGVFRQKQSFEWLNQRYMFSQLVLRTGATNLPYFTNITFGRVKQAMVDGELERLLTTWKATDAAGFSRVFAKQKQLFDPNKMHWW